MTAVTYRVAKADDSPSVDRVFRTTFCDTFAHLYRQQDLEAFLGKFTQDAWTSEITDPLRAVRLAEAEGEVIGYASVGPLTLPVETDVPAFELKQLYILKEWQGRGAARELMDWVVSEARSRGASELYLTVYTENWRARRFYERYAFVEHGPYAFMVGEQADEDIIMKKAL